MYVCVWAWGCGQGGGGSVGVTEYEIYYIWKNIEEYRGPAVRQIQCIDHLNLNQKQKDHGGP